VEPEQAHLARAGTRNTCDLRLNNPGIKTLPQFFREQGYVAVSYGKVFHQGFDHELNWSSQDKFKDGYPRGKAFAQDWVRVKIGTGG
jgi:hypothetical protein